MVFSSRTQMPTATITVRGMAMVTYWLSENRAPRPREGRMASGFVLLRVKV